MDFPKQTAICLARQGYDALVVDLFDGRLGRNVGESKALSKSLADNEAVAKYKAGLRFLK